MDGTVTEETSFTVICYGNMVTDDISKAHWHITKLTNRNATTTSKLKSLPLLYMAFIESVKYTHLQICTCIWKASLNVTPLKQILHNFTSNDTS